MTPSLTFKLDEKIGLAKPNWTFLKDRSEVEFQLLEPARSRTTWIVEHEGRIYIPCGYMNTTWGRIWKQWPLEAEKDGRALLRVDGVIYERHLRRVKESPALPVIVSELVRKYFAGTSAMSAEQQQAAQAAALQQIRNDSLWIFEMAPREQNN